MSPAEIIVRAKFAGVTMAVRDGQIVAKGPRVALTALVPHLREHKARLLELLPTAGLSVPTNRVVDFMTEAERRGLIVRYRVEDHDTTSTVMPGPGQTAEQLRESLRAELGDRLELAP